MATPSDALHPANEDPWRWLVLISCFFAKVFAQGIRKSFGVLLPTLQRQFDSEIWLLGSIVAIVCAVGDFLATLDFLHLPIFKEPRFYVIIVVSSTVRFTHMGWVIYLVPNVENKGIAPLYATLVAAVGGVGDATGKIISGVTLWRELLNSSALWICGMTILSISLIMDFMVTSSFKGMLVLGFFQSLGMGMSLSLNNVVLKDIFGTERLVNVMGWIRFFSGMARVLGGFVVGWIYSSSGYYSYGFVTLGCVQGLGMLVLVIGRKCIPDTE
ncbi:monocarboxylate transporter 5-like [Amphiura filiformis]|uniref:monocarboxylate transporter 5-like n=1 Tax=Amphiura filiformis TaxID=82378 RepID=UPI003B215E46